jgi:hypothetical protein
MEIPNMRIFLTMLLVTLFVTGCPEEDKKTDGAKADGSAKPAATGTASAKADDEGGW